MKTKLTLVKGAFYFLKSINLIKGNEQPVDLTELNEVELKGLKTQIAYGCILSSEDVMEYLTEATAEVTEDIKEPIIIPQTDPKPETPEVINHFAETDNPTVEEFIDEKNEDDKEQETDTETTKEADPYEGWIKSRVKKELEKRKIEFANDTLKDDLVLLLLEDDEKSKA